MLSDGMFFGDDISVDGQGDIEENYLGQGRQHISECLFIEHVQEQVLDETKSTAVGAQIPLWCQVDAMVSGADLPALFDIVGIIIAFGQTREIFVLLTAGSLKYLG